MCVAYQYVRGVCRKYREIYIYNIIINFPSKYFIGIKYVRSNIFKVERKLQNVDVIELHPAYEYDDGQGRD